MNLWLAFLFLALVSANVARAETGVTATEIKIGSTGSMSSDIQYGKSLAAGANAYYTRINKAGGIFGRKIQLLSLDDVFDPTRAVANANQLINVDKVFAFVGGNGSAGMKAILPLLVQNRVPLLFAYSGAEFLRAPNLPYVFNARVSYGEETEQLIDYLIDTKHLKGFGVFYQDDAFGTSGRDGVSKSLEKHGMRIVRSKGCPRQGSNFAEAVEELKASDVKVVYLASTTPLAVGFIRAALAVGYKPTYTGPSSAVTTAIPEMLGKGDYEIYASEVVPLPNDAPYAVAKDYVKDLRDAALEVKLPPIGFEGYVGARLFVEALKRAGSGLTRDGLKTAFESMKNYDLGGLPVSFSPTNHQGFNRNYLIHIANGEVTSLR